MTFLHISVWIIFILVVFCDSNASNYVFRMDVIAEFVTVDYLWDTSHSRSLYQETGQFVVANNAIAGIKVSESGDIYVTVPRWMSGVPSSLNKLVTNPNGPGYVLSPWPSWSFNAVGTGSLQYSQSFTIDSRNCMWIAEVGRTNFYDANPSLETTGPAGILVVNMTDGSLVHSYYFPPTVASYNASFVNDIVLDEVHGYAYLTDTWGEGGIIVYDIVGNRSHAFSGLSTERNSSYNFCVNGICYGTDGVGSSPSDGIALSEDGSVLYWSPVQGQGLYSISTAYLQDFSLSNTVFESHVIFLGYKTGCSDGLLYLNGNLFYGDLQNSALSVVNNVGGVTPQSVGEISDTDTSTSSPATLHWIDTFAPDLSDPVNNGIYFVTNRLNLFVSSSMDFTGQSGANFRIIRATYGPAASSSSMSDEITAGQVAAIVVGGFLFFVLSVAYHEYFHGNRKH